MTETTTQLPLGLVAGRHTDGSVMIYGRRAEAVAQLDPYNAVCLALDLLRTSAPSFGHPPQDDAICTAVTSILALIETWAHTLRAEVVDQRLVEQLYAADVA